MQHHEQLTGGTAFHREAAVAELPEILKECQSAIDRYLPVGSPLSDQLDNIRARLREGRLQLAVLGQFKRGKSTFLNGLLGAPYLPSAVVPVTALPTFIAWGSDPLIRVSYLDGRIAEQFSAVGPAALRETLHRFVAEEANPENRLGVSRIDVFVPAPILRHGIVLIDTPGVGSTHRHNTDAALKVLPECDAALFVVSVDPPITENEIAYLHEIRSRVARLFFVLNKTDLVETAELDQARKFMWGTLEKNGLISHGTEIFAVSARSGLAARQAADQAAFIESGMGAVEDYLLRFLTLEKTRSLETAVAMKASTILIEAETEINLRLRAMKLPLEALGEKQKKFEELLRPIEARRLVTRDLLEGERSRIVTELEARAERLRNEGRGRLFRIVDEITNRTEPGDIDRLAAEALAPTIIDFFDAARDETMNFIVEQSEEALGAHRARIGELVAEVRQTAANLFELSVAPVIDEEKFRITQEPYWINQRWASTILPDLSPIVDRMLGNVTRSARRGARIKARVDELIVRNVENLRWSILQGVDDTFLRAAATLEKRLDDAVVLARTAIASARQMHETQSDQVERELARLDAGATAVVKARTELAGVSKFASA